MAMRLFVAGFAFACAAVDASGRFGVINVAQDLGIQERQIVGSACPDASSMTVCAVNSDGSVECAAVCCYNNGLFEFGCKELETCDVVHGGCCPVGRFCNGPPPPCVDFGQPAVSPTSACDSTYPICTTSAGTPMCLGTISGGPIITPTSVTLPPVTSSSPFTSTSSLTTSVSSSTASTASVTSNSLPATASTVMTSSSSSSSSISSITSANVELPSTSSPISTPTAVISGVANVQGPDLAIIVSVIVICELLNIFFI